MSSHPAVTDAVDPQISDGENNSYSSEFTESEVSDYQPVWHLGLQEKGDVFYIEGKQKTEVIIPRPSHPESPDSSSNIKDKSKSKNRGLINKKHVGAEFSKAENLSHAVTFSHSPSGIVQELYLEVDPARHNYGRRATLCETLFGIIPGYFSYGESADDDKDDRIMVQGLVPNGEALKNGNVKIGDWLRYINDLEVNHINVNNILSAVHGPSQVKLTLHRFAGESPLIVRKTPVNANLVSLIAGESTDDVTSQLKDIPHHIVLYLTLEGISENAQGNEDILYQYPDGHNKLVEIRGMFITLVHMMHDVTGSSPTSLVINDQLIHVAYSREGREALVLALPAEKVSLYQLNNIMENVVRLMKVLYKSLGNAFGDKDNKSSLDHLFSLLFHQLLLPHLSREKLKGSSAAEKQSLADHHLASAFYDSLESELWLLLSDSVKVSVSDVMSELEAADFGELSDDHYDLRRQYTILGSCLFYKSYLIASHLPKEDLLDISLYLHYHQLLMATSAEPVGQIVIWKEVFPTRRHQGPDEPVIAGYTEPDGRWFLLIVGLENSILAVLLEAGGCTALAEGNPKPDPFYVEHVKNALLQIQTGEMPVECEKKLHSPNVPAIAVADSFSKRTSKEEKFKSQIPAKQGVLPVQRSVSPDMPPSILKKRPLSQQSSPALLGLDNRDSDSHSSISADSSFIQLKDALTNEQKRLRESTGNLSKGAKRKTNLVSAASLASLKRSHADLSLGSGENLTRLTRGSENVLFHYVTMDNAEGTFLCPIYDTSDCPLHKEIVDNFNACCMAIRTIFRQSTKAEKQKQSDGGKFNPDTALVGLREYGVRFSCPADTRLAEHKKGMAEIDYWVVGRLFDEPCPREVYVCYAASAPQNMVELAFKLSFGILF